MNDTKTDDLSTVQRVQQRLDEARESGQLAQTRASVPAAVSAPKPETTISIVEMSGDDLGELFGALAAAQGKFTEVERTLTARIKSKREGGADYTYDYAPLAEVLKAVRPALSENGLALMQFPLTRAAANHTSMAVRTMLGHKSGQWIRNDLVVSSVSVAPQDLASAITYARRYAMMAILGIAPDYDDDGAVASGRDQRSAPRGQQPPQKPAKTDGRVKVLAVQEIKTGNKTAWKVRTSAGECFTADEAMRDACRSAMQTEQVVSVVTEERPGSGGRKLSWLVELE